MIFADDIVLVDESRDSVNAKLERWREALESKGLIVNKPYKEGIYRLYL